MTAFLARLDGHLFTALFHLADALLELDRIVSKLEARWQARGDQRTPVRPAVVAAGRHRLKGKARPFDRADYEWGQALKRMASRMEGTYTAWQ